MRLFRDFRTEGGSKAVLLLQGSIWIGAIGEKDPVGTRAATEGEDCRVPEVQRGKSSRSRRCLSTGEKYNLIQVILCLSFRDGQETLRRQLGLWERQA